MAGPITQAVQNVMRLRQRNQQNQQQQAQFEAKLRFAEQKELSKRRLEATENARQEGLRRQVFQNNPELLSGPLRQPIPPAGFNQQGNGQPGAPPIPRPGQKQEIQARLQGLQKRQQENFKEFAIDNEENAKIFSQLPADVSAKLATALRTGRADSFARIKEQAGSFGSVAQQALSMKAGPRRNDFLIKDFETRQRLAESEGVQGPDPQKYLDIINATGNPDLQNSLLKNVVGTNRNIEKLITSKETQDKRQREATNFTLSNLFKNMTGMATFDQDFLLNEQRQTFIVQGNNQGVQEIDRMLRQSDENRDILLAQRGQQTEGKEVRKARLAPFTGKPGDIRFTGRGEPIAKVLAVDKPLSSIAKLNVDFNEGRITKTQRDLGIKKATEARALVNVSAFEKESEKLGARSNAAVRDEVRGNARTASRSLARVRNLSKLLKESPAGALTQFFPQIGRLIPGFDATNEQAALAQVNSFVLDQMKAFKGSTSDRELQFAETTVARLGNTREANEIILRSFENLIFLAQQENKQFDEFTKGGGGGRDFIFDFQKVIFPKHPKFGDVTLDDIQTTAFENGITMEETITELRKQ